MKRNSPENDSFRKEVLKRDKHRCQMPGCKKRTRLEIHHIFRWSDSPTLRYDVSNGITLCHFHHKEITGNEIIYVKLFLEIVRKNECNN